MLIDVITEKNRHLYTDQLHDMFEMRYRVVVEKWGWDIPTAKKNYEKDQFDYDDTKYFLAYDDNGKVNACGRLNPTTRPHLLNDIFPDQCEFEGVPRGKNIWEFSRFVVDGANLSSLKQLQASLKIALAITEYGLENNVKQLSLLAYKDTYTKTVALWKTKPLGLAKYYSDNDAYYTAGLCDVTEVAAKRIRRFARAKGQIWQCVSPINNENLQSVG